MIGAWRGVARVQCAAAGRIVLQALRHPLQQRRQQIALTGEIEEAIPVENDIEAHERKDEEFTMMAAAMKNLGEPCKSLLEDYYLHRRSMQEITEKFGYTNADNAKNQKYKCLMRLKKLFFIQYKKG